ncbi:MAG: nucleotide-diphospho-sugar transferase [Benjaminiella poitrasii]|nr:MAG: nucleotide-diphospho-sugar transferase [Benjaminiella poitrasii]
MTLHSRSFLTSKSIFRIVIAGVVTLCILWIYRSSLPKNKYCNTSTDCYNLLKEKARQFRQALPLKPTDISDPEPPTPPPQEQGNLDTLGTQNITLNQENEALDNEYKILTNTSLPRVKAAFVVLARNSELYALRSSMRYLEARFNNKYNYPWIFLNEQPFTEEFKRLTRMMTQSEVHYGLVPTEHWSYPDWINQTKAAESRKSMADRGIVYGGSESYRHMCRYQSGFFMMHPLLDGLDYYWRVEPGVKFSCDIDYDPFRLMQERNIKYGFTIALREYRATIPTLWQTTVEYAKSHPQYIYPRTRPDSLLRLVSHDNGWSYNLCHFWSNFEIASVKFMRSEGYQSYFRYLDKAGGFFYERWGDAPVHSIATALMLKKSDVHWFYDIGYKHDNFEHCPMEEKWLVNSKCYCDPATSFDVNPGSCTNLFLEVMERSASSYIVTRPDKDDLPSS